jgi:succinate-semialdehyde dehydrogenase/glutarate-semialdehyde dehydrogenase
LELPDGDGHPQDRPGHRGRVHHGAQTIGQLTPLSSLALAQILIDAGLPPGVLNVVNTTDAGGTTAPLLSRPAAAETVLYWIDRGRQEPDRAAAEQVLRVSMELGGNAPFLVFADADLDAALDGAMLAKMRNGGEACTSANRFYVQRQVAEEFATRLAERMGSSRLAAALRRAWRWVR